MKETSDEEVDKEDKRKTEDKTNYDDDDEEDDSVIEYVSRTPSTRDAWEAGSLLSHHDAGPVLVLPETDKTKDLGARPKEKTAEKKPEYNDKDSTKCKVVITENSTKDSAEVSKRKEDEKKSEGSDSHKDATEGKEVVCTDLIDERDRDNTDLVETTDAEVEGDTDAAKNLLRRSKRDRKPPKRFESYHMHQITSRPLDRKLQTLQKLLGSGERYQYAYNRYTGSSGERYQYAYNRYTGSYERL